MRFYAGRYKLIFNIRKSLFIVPDYCYYYLDSSLYFCPDLSPVLSCRYCGWSYY